MMMHYSKTSLTAIALTVSLFIGTQGAHGAEKKAVEKPSAPTKAGVVATVNGSNIAMEDFDRELNRIERQLLEGGRPLMPGQIKRLETEVAEGMVRRELLYQESKKKVTVGESEIDDEVKKLKAQYSSEADFNAALKAMNLSLATLRAQLERTLSIQKIMETEFVSKATITDNEIRDYYDKNREAFRRPEQIQARQILIKVDPQWDDARKTEARKKIEDVRSKVQEGQGFESLARTYSEDPSGSKGGDLGYISRGQVLKPFEEALFALKVGETSGVVETRVGYHVIKAGDRKPEMITPFDMVKDELGKLLKEEKGRQDANAYIAKVREKTKVEIFLPAE